MDAKQMQTKKKRLRITYPVRIQIEKKLDEGKRIREIAEEVGFPYATIYREIMANGGMRLYDAEEAQRRL